VALEVRLGDNLLWCLMLVAMLIAQLDVQVLDYLLILELLVLESGVGSRVRLVSALAWAVHGLVDVLVP